MIELIEKLLGLVTAIINIIAAIIVVTKSKK